MRQCSVYKRILYNTGVLFVIFGMMSISILADGKEEIKKENTCIKTSILYRAWSQLDQTLYGTAEEVIQPGAYPIMGKTMITVDQMVKYYESNGGIYPDKVLKNGGASDIQAFCTIYYEEAVAEGVKAEVAFTQTMKETGWLQYGGDSKVEQYNFAGLGTTGGGVQGNAFSDVRTGIRAQIQHLKAYATKEPLTKECVDNRYEYVEKGSAPYVEWLGQQENPAGKGWAAAPQYGYDIVQMIQGLKK
ncbi:MAG: glucosaminidase domain-containing protein [Lachnospiraceae bacterium]